MHRRVHGGPEVRAGGAHFAPHPAIPRYRREAYRAHSHRAGDDRLQAEHGGRPRDSHAGGAVADVGLPRAGALRPRAQGHRSRAVRGKPALPAGRRPWLALRCAADPPGALQLPERVPAADDHLRRLLLVPAPGAAGPWHLVRAAAPDNHPRSAGRRLPGPAQLLPALRHRPRVHCRRIPVARRRRAHDDHVHHPAADPVRDRLCRVGGDQPAEDPKGGRHGGDTVHRNGRRREARGPGSGQAGAAAPGRFAGTRGLARAL